MKTRTFQKPPLTIVALTVLVLAVGNVVAQDSTTSTTAPAAAPSAAVSQPSPQLSYGVPEVLKLSQAKVGDSTIIAYVQHSGNNYGLSADQIIYLRQQGVSDSVVNAMLSQRSQSAPTTTGGTASTSDSYQTSTATVQPDVTTVQTVPTSTVYVIPDTQTYYYNNWAYYHSPYYGYYPYYGYCYPYPAVSVSFGWGGGWHGGWHGDRGGFHGGGGFHSGGGGFHSGHH